MCIENGLVMYYWGASCLLLPLWSTKSRTFFKTFFRVPLVVQWKRTQIVSIRTRGQSLASLSGLRIWRCGELWHRSQMWLRSTLLWRRLAAIDLIQPLAWEPPYASLAALKKIKIKKNKLFFICLAVGTWVTQHLWTSEGEEGRYRLTNVSSLLLT